VKASASEEVDFEMQLMRDHIDRLAQEGKLQVLKALSDFERAQSARIQAVLESDLDPQVEQVLDEVQLDIERDVLPLRRFTPSEAPQKQPHP
jgi:predicted LPLAT superfamily acyltransferase